MRRITRALFTPFLLVAFVSDVVAPAYAFPAPSLGAASNYGVLTNSYINPLPGTTINGDIGFTTAPAIVPTGVHTNYGSALPYATAGADQTSTLAILGAQPCSFTFPAGPVNLATDISHGPIGVYTPGVYCTASNAFVAIGAAGITLNGAGSYLFRTGNITTAAGSVVHLTNGASVCNIWWTPSGPIADTLGSTELKDRLELKELPEEDRGRYNTLAGMIMLLLGRLPHTTDSVEWSGWRFEVVDLDGKRVDKVLASRLPESRDGASN